MLWKKITTSDELFDIIIAIIFQLKINQNNILKKIILKILYKNTKNNMNLK